MTVFDAQAENAWFDEENWVSADKATLLRQRNQFFDQILLCMMGYINQLQSDQVFYEHGRRAIDVIHWKEQYKLAVPPQDWESVEDMLQVGANAAFVNWYISTYKYNGLTDFHQDNETYSPFNQAIVEELEVTRTNYELTLCQLKARWKSSEAPVHLQSWHIVHPFKFIYAQLAVIVEQLRLQAVQRDIRARTKLLLEFLHAQHTQIGVQGPAALCVQRLFGACMSVLGRQIRNWCVYGSLPSCGTFFIQEVVQPDSSSLDAFTADDCYIPDFLRKPYNQQIQAIKFQGFMARLLTQSLCDQLAYKTNAGAHGESDSLIGGAQWWIGGASDKFDEVANQHAIVLWQHAQVQMCSAFDLFNQHAHDATLLVKCLTCANETIMGVLHELIHGDTSLIRKIRLVQQIYLLGCSDAWEQVVLEMEDAKVQALASGQMAGKHRVTDPGQRGMTSTSDAFSQKQVIQQLVRVVQECLLGHAASLGLQDMSVQQFKQLISVSYSTPVVEVVKTQSKGQTVSSFNMHLPGPSPNVNSSPYKFIKCPYLDKQDGISVDITIGLPAKIIITQQHLHIASQCFQYLLKLRRLERRVQKNGSKLNSLHVVLHLQHRDSRQVSKRQAMLMSAWVHALATQQQVRVIVTGVRAYIQEYQLAGLNKSIEDKLRQTTEFDKAKGYVDAYFLQLPKACLLASQQLQQHLVNLFQAEKELSLLSSDLVRQIEQEDNDSDVDDRTKRLCSKILSLKGAISGFVHALWILLETSQEIRVQDDKLAKPSSLLTLLNMNNYWKLQQR